MSVLPTVYSVQPRAQGDESAARGKLGALGRGAGPQKASWRWNATPSVPMSTDDWKSLTEEAPLPTICTNLSKVLPLHLVPYCWDMDEEKITSFQPSDTAPHIRALAAAIKNLDPGDPLRTVFYTGGASQPPPPADGVAIVPVSNGSLLNRDAHGAHGAAGAAAFEYRAPRVAHELACAELRDDPSYDMVPAAQAVQVGNAAPVPEAMRAAFGPGVRPVAQPVACNDRCAAEVLVSALRLPALPVVMGRSLWLSDFVTTDGVFDTTESSAAQVQATVNASLNRYGGFRRVSQNPVKLNQIPTMVWGGELAALLDRVTWYGAWRSQRDPPAEDAADAEAWRNQAAAVETAWRGHTTYRAFGQQCALVDNGSTASASPVPSAITERLAAGPLFAPRLLADFGSDHGVCPQAVHCGACASWDVVRDSLANGTNTKTLKLKQFDGKPMTEAQYGNLTQTLLVLRPSEFHVFPCCAAIVGADVPRAPPAAPTDRTTGANNRAPQGHTFAPDTMALMGAHDLQWSPYNGEKDIVLLRADWSGFGPSVLSGTYPEHSRVEQNECLPVCGDEVGTQTFLATRMLAEAAVWGGLLHGDDAAFTHVVTDCETGRVYACTADGFKQHVRQIVLWGSEATGDNTMAFASAPCVFVRGPLRTDGAPAVPPAATTAAPQLAALLSQPLRPIEDMAHMATDVPAEWRLQLSATTVTLARPAQAGEALVLATGSAPTVEPATLMTSSAGQLVLTVGGKPLTLALELAPTRGPPDLVGYPCHRLGNEWFRACRGGFMPLLQGALGAWFVSADRKRALRIDLDLVTTDGNERIGYTFPSGAEFSEEGMFDLLLSDETGGADGGATHHVHYALVGAPGASLTSREGKAVTGVLLGRHDTALQTRQFRDCTAVVIDARNVYPNVTDMTKRSRGPLMALALGVTPIVPTKVGAGQPNRAPNEQRAVRVGAALGGAALGGALGALLAR